MRQRRTKRIKPVHSMNEKTIVFLVCIMLVILSCYTMFIPKVILGGIGFICTGLISFFIYYRYESKKHNPDKFPLIYGTIIILGGCLLMFYL